MARVDHIRRHYEQLAEMYLSLAMAELRAGDSLHATSKEWAPMTLGRPIEGAGLFVASAPSTDLP
jgi:hypothetical protein